MSQDRVILPNGVEMPPELFVKALRGVFNRPATAVPELNALVRTVSTDTYRRRYPLATAWERGRGGRFSQPEILNRRSEWALTQIQRLMLVSFLEGLIRSFWGSGRDGDRDGRPRQHHRRREPGKLATGDDIRVPIHSGSGIHLEMETATNVYITLLDDVRDLDVLSQRLLESLVQLVAVDGVDTVIDEEVKVQQRRATRAFLTMTDAIAASHHDKDPVSTHPDLESFFTYAENMVARVLLMRAWARCFVDPLFGFQVALSQLVHELGVQNKNSQTRRRALTDVFLAGGRDWNPLYEYYRALLNQLRTPR